MMWLLKLRNRSGFPEEDGELAKLEEDVFLGLMDDVRSKVLAHHTVPAAAVLIHLVLEVPRQHSLLLVLLETVLEAGNKVFLDLLDFLGVHVRRLHLGLQLDVALCRHTTQNNLNTDKQFQILTIKCKQYYPALSEM